MTTITRPTGSTRRAQVAAACARLVDLLADRPLPAGDVAAPDHANPQLMSYVASRQRLEEETTP